ncbi:MAG: hypothetical protein FWE38_05080 [Firmicutes bacterium]|nr:hypothetical protein [Bacillota bacterium]
MAKKGRPRFFKREWWTPKKAIIASCMAVVLLTGAVVGAYFIFRPFRATPMVATGFDHTVVLRQDGTVWAWGRNEEGQLGNGNRVNQFTPVRARGLDNIVQIASHKVHTLYLRNDGTVWAAGWNEEGQLGAAVGCSLDAIQVTRMGGGFLEDIIQVDAGMLFSVALRRDGTVWAWGRNRMGTAGDPNIEDQARASQVMELSNIISISAGHEHVLALHRSGRVYAWGRNRNGQVGDPTIDPTTGRIFDIRPPVRVHGLPNDIVAVAGGGFHSLALTRGGHVWAWGRGDRGQLGHGYNVGTQITPVQVANLDRVRTITSASGDSNAVIRRDGTVWTWGRNREGQLGDGTTTDRNVPVAAQGIGGGRALQNVISVSAGETHMSAILRNGDVVSWGSNWDGQLGNDGLITTAGPSTAPVQVRQQVHGTHGMPEQGGQGLPAPVVDRRYLTGVSSIATGNLFTLTLMPDGNVWGWGRNNHGQLVMQNSIDHRSATRLYDFRMHDPRFPWFSTTGPNATKVLNDVVAISAGLEVGHGFGLAITRDGYVYGWADNIDGMLGIGNRYRTLGDQPKDNNPRRMYYINNASAIAAGGRHSLILQDGEVWATGLGSHGRLGLGTDLSRRIRPERLTTFPAGTVIEHIEAGMASSFAIDSTGHLWAWGHNGSGRLGDGTDTHRNTPVRVLGPSVHNAGRIVEVSSYNAHTLARGADGRVWAWGANWSGRLGDGTQYERRTPTLVQGIVNATHISAGANHSVAVVGGNVWTWGENARNQLGRSTPSWNDRLTPRQISGVSNVTYISAGGEFTVVRSGTGSTSTVWAWGSNNAGALGNGINNYATTPHRARGVHHSFMFINAFSPDFAPTVEEEGSFWTVFGVILGLVMLAGVAGVVFYYDRRDNITFQSTTGRKTPPPAPPRRTSPPPPPRRTTTPPPPRRTK